MYSKNNVKLSRVQEHANYELNTKTINHFFNVFDKLMGKYENVEANQNQFLVLQKTMESKVWKLEKMMKQEFDQGFIAKIFS